MIVGNGVGLSDACVTRHARCTAGRRPTNLHQFGNPLAQCNSLRCGRCPTSKKGSQPPPKRAIQASKLKQSTLPRKPLSSSSIVDCIENTSIALPLQLSC